MAFFYLTQCRQEKALLQPSINCVTQFQEMPFQPPRQEVKDRAGIHPSQTPKVVFSH